MKILTKTQTGSSTRTSGIRHYVKPIQLTKYFNLNFFAKAGICFLFALAITGITGFTIIWFDSLLSIHGVTAFVMLPFLVGLNLLNGIIAVKGFNILKQDLRGKIL
tara:strand:+ start:522 stop:839 length:318 start_codon:yes stop_codon:yes gene_type:complete